MNDIEIRPARAGEVDRVAELRWQWITENGRNPPGDRAGFCEHFVEWAERNASSHECFVVARGEAVIGMAWLATVRRVPSPNAYERESGDVQCVYVVPAERDSGVGGRLIEAVLARARELGLERVTVHSSPRAVTAYVRRGFVASPRLLHVSPAS